MHLHRALLGLLLALSFSLTACERKSPERLQGLIQQLSSADGKERNTAALTIGSYGEAGKAAVPALIKLLQTDKSRGIRTSAAFALRSIGTKDAIAALDAYKE